MTEYDLVLLELGEGIGKLTTRSKVGFFWASSAALLPAYSLWARHNVTSNEGLLQSILRASRDFAEGGTVPLKPEQLLRAFGSSTPPGEAIDEFSTATAQDCWICADICLRVIVDDTYEAGPAVEYALEPTMAYATEQLYGVSQLGSSDKEDQQTNALLRHPSVRSAIDYCRWATNVLWRQSPPPHPLMDEVAKRAGALLPPDSS